MTNKKVKEIITPKHWGSLATGYLCLAEQGFLFLQEQKNIGKNRLFQESEPVCLLAKGNLLIASIWNVKHGLELVIKALGVSFNKQYWNDHDMYFLFEDLKNKISEHSLSIDIKMLQLLVDKYYNCNFSPKTSHQDIKNDYLKYPEIDNVSLDYSFVHDLKRRDLNQFLKDIYNIKRAYDLLEAEIAYYKSGYKAYKKKLDKELFSVNTIKKHGYKK